MTADTTAAAIACLALGAGLLAAIAVTTPWRILPGAPLRLPPGDPDADFTAEEQRPGTALHRALRPALLTSAGVDLAVAALLALSPVAVDAVRRVTRGAGAWPAGDAALGAAAITAVFAVAGLPAAARVETVLRRHGLSTRRWRGWLADRLRGLVISLPLAAGAAATIVALARASPRWWPLLLGAAAATATLLVTLLQPLVLEPVFNRFQPLPAGNLRTDLRRLTTRAGVPVRDILVADASRRTTAMNAYVSGLGATRRVVVYDTLLRTAEPAEVGCVVAHELGHVRHRDVLTGALIGALGAACAGCGLGLVLARSWVLDRLRITGAGDPAVVAALPLLGALAGMAAAPIGALVSRRVEARADVFALDVTGDPATFAAMQRRLALANRSDLRPNVVLHVLAGTHPTVPQRLALRRRWQRGTAAAAGTGARGLSPPAPGGGGQVVARRVPRAGAEA